LGEVGAFAFLLHQSSIEQSLRLCRLMCGKAMPFREVLLIREGFAPILRRSLKKLIGPDRKAKGFPHIKRRSRGPINEEALDPLAPFQRSGDNHAFQQSMWQDERSSNVPSASCSLRFLEITNYF
jgi:hypothetical protein